MFVLIPANTAAAESTELDSRSTIQISTGARGPDKLHVS